MKECEPGKNPGGGGGGGSGMALLKKPGGGGGGGGRPAPKFGGYPDGSGGRLAEGIEGHGIIEGCGGSGGCGSEDADINNM